MNMNENKLKDKELLLSAKTPNEYIQYSLVVKISSGRKSKITREWFKKTNFNVEDIIYARNRNSYWKYRKGIGNIERNRIRQIKHNYRIDGDIGHIMWPDKNVKFLLNNNNKKDWELAKILKTTIPAIQAYRRKINMLEKLNIEQRDELYMKLIKISETALRSVVRKTWNRI